ncbi:C-OmpA-like family protein CmpA [Legionella sp. W05-934-2]|jgi:outer membrane protein OmpA-like peptidoglycan-associated protein|uniref:C-OmpA-like family protein CmpA n=1 Tax=Legionella sp. W05-934-2 TaxID=1198649 RepID=UPI0034630031
MGRWFRYIVIGLIGLNLQGCFHPPYNHFKLYNRTAKDTLVAGSAGAVAGALAGSTVTGLGLGIAAGTTYGLYHESESYIIRQLENQSIQYIQYGDTHTLIIPTDKYFLINSANINDLAYPGLNNVAKLLNKYPDSQVFVAGFTDDIGSKLHQRKMSQAQAEAMLTFLWAYGISAQCLDAEGYGQKFAVGDNKLIHGSAYNRRIEIQWYHKPNQPKKLAFMGWKN